MTVLNTLSFEDAIDLVNRSFDAGKADPMLNVMKTSGLVKVTSVPANSGGQRRHKETPVGEQYASIKAQGGESVKTRVQQGYSKDTNSRTFALAIDITLEMRQLDKTGVYQAIKFIGDGLPNREDLNLSLHLGMGTATSYTDKDGQTVDISTGDGLALWSTVHTLTGASTTFRARVASNPAFSESALETAEDTLRTNTLSNLGETLMCDPDTIVTTNYPTLVNSVKRLLNSTSYVASGFSDGVSNVYQGKYKHIILPRLDCDANGNHDTAKKNYWILADSKILSFFHDVYMDAMLSTPSKGNNGEDINTLDWTFNTVAMHGSCIVSARGMMFSSGDAA